MNPKPAPPVDRSNAVMDPPEASRALIAELARTLPGFARMMARR